MFLLTYKADKDGNLSARFVNLMNATVIHAVDPDAEKNYGSFNSVIFMSNGYACYSYLYPEEIVMAVQGEVVTESSIKDKLSGE